jgi:FkbM family methyltransferase
MKKIMKSAVDKALRYFGYEAKSTRDAFTVQKELINTITPVIFDVGAHVGSVTLNYRNLFPLASIYCFEPFPQSFEKLLQNLEGDPRSSCYKSAVSAEKGTAVLNANLSSATNSLLATGQRGSSYWGAGLLDTTSRIEVETTTIDIFLQEKGITHIDILKLDVQGAEYSVFEGAKETLSRQRVSLIYTELIMCPTYEGQHKLHEYLALLDSFGYGLLDFFGPVRKQQQLIQADLIFLGKDDLLE